MADKIVENAKGKKFKVIRGPIKKIVSKHLYCWVGPKKRQKFWNSSGEMDFIIDGLVHRCKKGNEYDASFFDSPDPKRMWLWANVLKYFRECVPV